jgi:hypothetical protein
LEAFITLLWAPDSLSCVKKQTSKKAFVGLFKKDCFSALGDGTMRFVDGKLVHVSNQSGHYMPRFVKQKE